MTTRLNLRNISRKNITVEINPRNNGSVAFTGVAPRNAVIEAGAMKLTLSTQKIDRVGLLVPPNMPEGDLILESVGDQQIGRALLGASDAYWGDNGERLISDHSLAQMGIGYTYNHSILNEDNDDDLGYYIAMYNNTDQPIVLGGSVDLNGDFYGGSSGGGVEATSLADGVDEPSESDNYLEIDSKLYNVAFQDPDLINPTFAQERGRWGVVLGAEHHRAGTSVNWVFTLPPQDSEILNVYIYLPYTHVNRYGQERRGQAIYLLSRPSNSSSWFNDVSQLSIGEELAGGIIGYEDEYLANRYTDESEYCLRAAHESADPYSSRPPTGYSIYTRRPEVTTPWNPDAPTIDFTTYLFDYNSSPQDSYGQNMSLSLTGLRYVGLDKDGNNVDGNDNATAYNRDNYQDGWVNEMSASKIILHPNEPFFNNIGLTIDEEMEGKIAFINAARNTYDIDGLGYSAEYGNLKDFVVRSAGYNSTGRYYAADGSELIFSDNSPVEMPS